MRFSVRTILVLVAFFAGMFGAYQYGWREGQRLPRDPLERRALRFVGGIRTTSDEEASAIYQQALRHERERPGFLAEYKLTEVKKLPPQPNLPGGEMWSTIFISTKGGGAYEDHGEVSIYSVSQYRAALGR
jgi:hypothetical protein